MRHAFLITIVLLAVPGPVLAQTVESDIELLLTLTPFGRYDDYTETQEAYARYAGSPSAYIAAIDVLLTTPDEPDLLTYPTVIGEERMHSLINLLIGGAHSGYGKQDVILVLTRLYNDTSEDYSILYTELTQSPPTDPEELGELDLAVDAIWQLHVKVLMSLAELGDYSVLQHALDRHASESYDMQTYIEGFSTYFTGSYPPPSFSMDLAASWQLIGLPFEPLNTAYDSLFQDTPLLQPPFSWSDDRYALENELAFGKGYWAEFSTAGIQQLSGIPVDSFALDLSAGWHLISGPSCDIEALTIDDPSGIIIAGTLFGFDNGYIIADTLRQGQGYWMMANGTGQVILDCNATTAGKAQLPAIVYRPNTDGSFTEISIRDANRGQQTLFLGGTLSTTSQVSFSLPPIPPQGFFDARFEGGTRLIEESEGLVLLQVSQFPVTLSLGGKENGLVLEELAGDQVIDIRTVSAGESIEITNPAVSAVRLSLQ